MVHHVYSPVITSDTRSVVDESERRTGVIYEGIELGGWLFTGNAIICRGKGVTVCRRVERCGMQAMNEHSSTNPRAAPTKHMKGLGGGIARWGTRWIRKEWNYHVGGKVRVENNERSVVDQSEA